MLRWISAEYSSSILRWVSACAEYSLATTLSPAPSPLSIIFLVSKISPEIFSQVLPEYGKPNLF